MRFSVHALPAPLTHWHPVVLLCSGFGSGYIKPASGTWGSLLAFFCLFPAMEHLTLEQKVILTALITLIGQWSIQHLSHLLKRRVDDASWIVIDEWAGLALALSCAQSAWGAIAAFIFFRLFDIVKKGPVGWVDRRVKGSHGIMLDDLVAGVMAGLVVLAFEFWVLPHVL